MQLPKLGIYIQCKLLHCSANWKTGKTYMEDLLKELHSLAEGDTWSFSGHENMICRLLIWWRYIAISALLAGSQRNYEDS